MYRNQKRVHDREFEYARMPKHLIESTARLDLLSAMMKQLADEGRQPEDFLLRYTTTRDYIETSLGVEWFTQYTLSAIPLEDAKALLGGL